MNRQLRVLVVMVALVLSDRVLHAQEALKAGCDIAVDQSELALLPIEPQQIDDAIAARIKPGATARSIALKDLPNERLQVGVRVIAADGKVSYLLATASGKDEQFRVTVDYTRFATLCIADRMNIVGVGFRIEIQGRTTSAKLDLGNLFAIGAAGSASKATGLLNLTVIGIADRDITVTIPTFSTLSQESVGAAIQAMAIVKSKLAEKQDAIVQPHILAKQIVASDVESASNGRLVLKASVNR